MLANQQADLISTIPLSNPIPSPFHRLKPLAHIRRSNLFIFIHSFYYYYSPLSPQRLPKESSVVAVGRT